MAVIFQCPLEQQNIKYVVVKSGYQFSRKQLFKKKELVSWWMSWTGQQCVLAEKYHCMWASICSSMVRRSSCNRKKKTFILFFYPVLFCFPAFSNDETKAQRICGLSILWNIKHLTGPSPKLLYLTLNKALRLILEQVTCRGSLQNRLLHKTAWIYDSKVII